VLSALGLARRFLDFGNAALHYLSEAAFPVYVLHQVAIVVPGYCVVRLALGITAKVLLLLAVSVCLTFVVYHFVVRSLRPARFLLGMRPKARPLFRLAARTVGGLFLVGAGLTTATAGTPEGLWYAEGGAAQVEVSKCGPALCAKVVWLRSPFDENGCELRDVRNVNQRLRARPIEGLLLFEGLEQSSEDPNVWTGGTVYDPTSGRTYRCRLSVDGDRLHLRGYLAVPILGRTTTWIRVGTERRVCRQATGESAQ
jgi:uncharacterized protein (DUF2147 family)